MGLSNYSAHELLDHAFGAAAYSAAATHYFCALKMLPTDADTGSTLVEAPIARKAATNNLTTYNAASSRAKTNAIDITFTAASEDLGYITHWGIADASSAGNLLASGALDEPQYIADTEVLQFDAGDLSISLTAGVSGLSDYLVHKLLDLMFGAQSYTAASTIYVAACQRPVASSDTGSTIIEPSIGGYARVGLTNNATNFPAASARTKLNAAAAAFARATADIGIINYIAALDASSAGNMLWFGEPPSVNLLSGVALAIAAGDFEAFFRSS